MNNAALKKSEKITVTDRDWRSAIHLSIKEELHSTPPLPPNSRYSSQLLLC